MKIRRFYSTLVRQRFYKDVSIVSATENCKMTNQWSAGAYEICLDGKKIKTPRGEVLAVPSESLAMAAAQEWRAQQKIIKAPGQSICKTLAWTWRNSIFGVEGVQDWMWFSSWPPAAMANLDIVHLVHEMHLTGLCITCVDNPLNDTKQNLVQDILRYFDNDTLLFFQDEPESFKQLQQKTWTPIIDWVKETYDVDLEPSQSLDCPEIPAKTRQKIENHLSSYEFWPLHGFKYAVETVKSLILVLACVNCQLTVEQAVRLASLEQTFQSTFWGNVEWAHDVDFHEQCCRLSAAVLFIRLLTSKYENSQKL